MWVYRKSDRKCFELKDAVKYKTLWNKAQKMRDEILKMSDLLTFQCEDYETKTHMQNAYVELRKFQHNLKLKFEIEQN